MLSVVLIASFLVFNTVNAGLEFIPPQEAPAGTPKADGCYISELGSYVTTYRTTDGSCLQYNCNEDTGVTSKASCPTFTGNCDIVVGDPSATYPGCCASISCGEGQSGTGVN